MQGSKYKITKTEKTRAEYTAHDFKQIMEAVEFGKKYTIGDVFIMKEKSWSGEEDKEVFVTQSYHWDRNSELNKHPQKYEVVHFDSLGLMHFKGMFADGSYSGIESIRDYYCSIKEGDTQFQIDPDQLDAVILEEEYRPLAKIQKVIADKQSRMKHNEDVRIRFQDNEAVKEFVDNIQIGDSYYVNAKTQYTCTNVETMSPEKLFKSKKIKLQNYYLRTYKNEMSRIMTGKWNSLKVRKDRVKVITWSSTSGRTLTHTVVDIKKGRFYKAQPQYKKSKKLQL